MGLGEILQVKPEVVPDGKAVPDWTFMHEEFKRKGVTRDFLAISFLAKDFLPQGATEDAITTFPRNPRQRVSAIQIQKTRQACSQFFSTAENQRRIIKNLGISYRNVIRCPIAPLSMFHL